MSVTDVKSGLRVTSELSDDRTVAEFKISGAKLHDWGFTMTLRADFDSEQSAHTAVQATHISKTVGAIHEILPRYFDGPRGLVSYSPSSMRVRSTRPIDTKPVEWVRDRIEEILSTA